MVIQPGPFKLKAPATEPREIDILILDKEVDIHKKYILNTEEDTKNTRNGALRNKYNETRYYTPGSALRQPIRAEWKDSTSEEKIIESARAVRDKAETKAAEFVLLVPAPFFGHWNENATTWIQRFIRHVDSTKRPLLNEELVEYVGYQLEGRAKWWHKSASQLYPEWEQYVESFLYEFHPSKNKKIAKDKLKDFKIYSGDLLENYAQIMSIFRVLETTDVDEQVDVILEKLNRQDRETVVQLNMLTTFQIFDFLIGRKERDRRFGGAQNKLGIPIRDELGITGRDSRKVELTAAVRESRSCYNCNKVGHISSDCPEKRESRRSVGNNWRAHPADPDIENGTDLFPGYTPSRKPLEFGGKARDSMLRARESRRKRFEYSTRNSEVNALQLSTGKKLKSGEYTGIGGLVKINNRNITWQLDTGAGFNVISEQLALELGLESQESNSAVLVSANGTRNESRYIPRVEMEFSGLKVSAPFYTMTEGRENLLLIGLQTLQELGATVDINQEKIRLHKNGITYELSLKKVGFVGRAHFQGLESERETRDI
ncbi:hypothetical protein AYI70_g6437 [Smittium culicis]|uniref:CCHC-type domain-containing protein n=1 Tax=Smittium culicis TaxID=133412 RepID=A0A1R1XPX0_9FUNG|nr:hypothetical protein AYI70_g6437 [Smittium culicis]